MLRRLRELQPRGSAAMIAPRRLAGWLEREGIRGVHPESDSPEQEELAALAAGALRAAGAGRLLVDVFPRGILGELAPLLESLPRPPWLIARRVRPDYYLDAGVRRALESRYERLLWCEEPPESLQGLALVQQRVGPVLVRRASECLSRRAARRALAVADDERLLLALGSGDRGHQRDLLRLLSKLVGRGVACRLVFISDLLPPRRERRCAVEPRYPAMAYLPGADLVVAGGGYASFNETVATGVPTVYLPQRRRYDDQHWRVRGRPTADAPQRLEAAIRGALGQPGAPAPAAVEDGAAQIAAALVDASGLSPRRACT